MFAFVVFPGETLLLLLMTIVVAIPLAVLALASTKWLKKTVTGSDEPVITNRPPDPPASPYRDRG
jgi:hypothetical protein